MPNGLPDGAELAYFVKGQVHMWFCLKLGKEILLLLTGIINMSVNITGITLIVFP